MVTTQKIVNKRNPQGGLETVMEEVNSLSLEHTRPSDAGGGDTSNVNVHEGDLNNQHDHVDNSKDAKNYEEEEYGKDDYVKDGFYKDGYHYEHDLEMTRVSKELFKTERNLARQEKFSQNNGKSIRPPLKQIWGPR
uniref:Uncharacterized protein n=1 Tax=Cannabis sativa TaxID=3483 RepID=A0A803QCJ4_CANSA